ncbi:PREDICTED: F-box protein At5g03100-like [Nicotiana attenuata]|uniref:F-boxlrr-repeat protein n=1 Tax=Nicotiana attenuata TaxID=49451 RepID=A0A1J6KBX7_NICAT|nr:PREDICTED: F-box protein At5g03100-like [Nicotiana attenuata]OIT22464.1 putative f-boxlrr-repeat protein [Nicotiana attenuata]
MSESEEEAKADLLRGKRRKTEKTDRISALPDSLILHILSFLQMDEVIRTGVLSKRWHLLWTSAQTLIFSYSSPHDHGTYSKFVTFIDDTLLRCQPSKLNKFSVDFIYSRRFVRHVTKWITFVKNKYVEELNLHLRSRDLNEIYDLPELMYSNMCLRDLSLRHCNLVPKGEINWPSLRVLEIGYAELNQDFIKKICSGCPALESLKFRSCYGIGCFNIDSKSVKKLVIKGCWDDDDDDNEEEKELGIYARNVTSLEISGHFHRKILVLQDVKALVDAKLNVYRKLDEYIHNYEGDFKTDQNMVKDLLVSLQHVEKLSIGTWCLQVLATLEMRTLSCPRMRCKNLTLNTHMKKWELPGITILLQSCPQVETLNIDMTSRFEEYYFGLYFKKSNDFSGGNYWISRPCWVLYLKTLRIYGFWGGNEYILSFLEVVLKNAMVLEKIFIGSSKNEPWIPTDADYRRVANKMLSFPRSSKDAVILFSG